MTGLRTKLSTSNGKCGQKRLDMPLKQWKVIHWVDSEGMAQIESWKNSKTLISQEDYEKLDETQREGKYSLDKIESYFTLFESLLAPKSNPLLAVEEWHFAKQGSMNS